jgi:3-oxoacyl-(acyl-carrier-protein) synthase
LHGTGTLVNDLSEFRALSAIFGDTLPSIPACSTKPMTGHTFGASGVLNAVFSILSMKENIIPATLFQNNLDEAFTGITLLDSPGEYRNVKTVLSTSLGFGGEAFALIIEKADE